MHNNLRAKLQNVVSRMITEENRSGVQKLLAEDHHDLDLLLSAVFDALDVRNPAEILARLDLFWARLAMHIRAENLRLFPAIANGMEKHSTANDVNEKSNIDDAIGRLRADHDFFMRQLANGVNGMRKTTSGPSDRAKTEMAALEVMLAEVRERLKTHNQLEEEIVYRLPSKLLDELTQLALEQGINHELENLPPRFKINTQNRSN